MKLPQALSPYIAQLKALYEPLTTSQQHASNSKMESLNPNILDSLTKRLNRQRKEQCTWVMPDIWSMMSKKSSLGYAPVASRVIFYHHIPHLDVNFSAFQASRKDSFIVFKSLNQDKKQFGRIHSIFTHRRSPEPGKFINDTWVCVQVFQPLLSSHYNPFSRVAAPDVQVELRLWDGPETSLILLDEVVAHCAWIMYGPKSIHKDLNVSTVAMVSLER